MKMKYFLILSDVIHGKISISELKNMKNTLETLQSLTKLKKVKFRYLQLLNRENLTICCNQYNRYTNGKKIPIDVVYQDLDWIADKLKELNESGFSLANLLSGSSGKDLSLLPTLLRGIKNK